MTPLLLWSLLLQHPAPEAQRMFREIVTSGRVATLAETPDERVTSDRLIAPGPPPLLSFRYYEGKSHHRFGNADLMLDDAGH